MKFSKTLAPITPFVTEVFYQNLVVDVQPEAYESLHHCTWPKVEEDIIDEELISQMGMARRIASLGLSARSSAGIKLRQPLSDLLVHAGKYRQGLDDSLVAVLIDELNVKSISFVEDATALIQYQILPDNKLLGPKFGARFPQVRAALSVLKPTEVAEAVQAGNAVILQVGDEEVSLAPEEILVQTQPAEGLAVAADKGATVGIETEISAELRAEGLAREIVRRIQAMRKKADFNIEDRITTYFQTEGELAEVMGSWADYIQAETLTTQLMDEAPTEDAYTETHELAGLSISLGVKR